MVAGVDVVVTVVEVVDVVVAVAVDDVVAGEVVGTIRL